MTHALFDHHVNPVRALAWSARFALLLAVFLLIPHIAHAAQETVPARVPGEILLGWRADSATCEPTDPALAEANIPPETCRLLADLAPAGVQPQGLLAEQRDRPEWQAARRALAALTGLEVRDLLLPYAVARLSVAPGRAAAEIDRLRQLPWVAYAEPNYIAQAAGALADARYPNDPRIGDQWNMRRVFGPEAWAVTRGSYSIVVAVLDSGIDLYHPEFTNRLLPGYDYVQKDRSPYDDNGHGTHVAGLIAANADNGAGISGLAPNIRLLPYKVLDYAGQGNYGDIATAIIDAANANAQVINLSLGGIVTSATLQNAVSYAQSRGALVVAAAGNCAQPVEACYYVTNPEFYPAAYAGVLAVAASDHYDNWAPYSNYRAYVGLAAPGGLFEDPILSTFPRALTLDGYGFDVGTSMATPLVSAAAALVWTMQPAASAQQVANILKNTADKVGVDPFTGQPLAYVNGRNDYFGYGRLNVAQAVRLAYPPTLTPINEVQRFLTDNPMQGSARAIPLLNPSEQAVQWHAQVIQGASWLSVPSPDDSTSYSRPGVLNLHVGPAALSPGVYTGLVRVTAVPPAQIAPLDIRVELQVAAQLRHAYAPLLLRDWYGIGWLDPFAPAAPAPLPLSLANDTAYPVTLPFPVTFYGQSYLAAWVSDNGLVWFGQGSAEATQPPATGLPSAAAPNNAIYVLALDWNPESGGRVYAHRPDADTFAITWYEVQRPPWNTTPQSFQVVFRRTGEILATYRAIENQPPALIGVENADGTVAEQIYFSGAGRRPVNGDTLRFEAILPWR